MRAHRHASGARTGPSSSFVHMTSIASDRTVINKNEMSSTYVLQNQNFPPDFGKKIIDSALTDEDPQIHSFVEIWRKNGNVLADEQIQDHYPELTRGNL